MTIYIFGAGPTGLAVGDALIDKGIRDFIIFESQDQIGGLATTLKWNGIGSHELGPHKLFTLNDWLFQRVKSILPDSMWLKKDKVSSIYLNGYFLSYPPNPFSLLKVYGAVKFFRIIASFAFSKIKHSKNPVSFKEDLTQRVGLEMYNVLFSPMATKIWGDPSKLSIKLSQGRIQTPSIREIILTTIGLRRKSEFEALAFLYPRGGLITIWNALMKKISPDRFVLSAKISNLELKSGRIDSFSVLVNDVEKVYKMNADDFIVSTLPILKTYEFISKNLEGSILDKAKDSIKLNDLFLVFLNIDKEKLFDESWVFVPDPKISFHRVSEQASFDPDMTMNGSILCAEIMMTEGKYSNLISDEELMGICILDLRKVFKKDFEVLNSKIVKLKKSYPVYQIGYETIFSKVIEQMDDITNFKTIGRQGSFNYIGTLDSMDIGYGIVDWFVNSKSGPWENERMRTSDYPVLD
jgi:protoporphyrinogen oxidase